MSSSSRSLKPWFLGLLATYLLAGMHFFMHNQGGSGFYLPFNMVGWIFISPLIGLGLWQVTRSRQLVITPLQLGLWLAFALLLVPLFYPNAELRDQALPRLLGIGGGLLFLFSLTQWRLDPQTRTRLLYLILGAALLEAALGLVQYFLLTPGNWIGYNTVHNRPYGIFQQVNVMATFLATGLALALYLLRWDAAVMNSRWRQAMLAAALLSIPLLLVVIISRAGHVGALPAVGGLLPLLWRHDARLGRLALLAILLSLVAGVFSLYFGHIGRSLESYQQLSGSKRLLYWSHAWEMIRESPWLGFGYGSFESQFTQHYYAPERLFPGLPRIEPNLDHPHNETLYWLLEGGIVAGLGLLVAFGAYVRQLARIPGWSKRLSLLALVLPILFHSQVEYPFYHSLAHWIVFLMLLWLADEEGGQARVLDCPYWLLLRTLAVGIPLLVVPFMLTGVQTAYLVTKYERGGMRQPELLLQVINPLPWQTRFEFDVMTFRLMAAMRTNNQAELEAYADWARSFIAHTPRSQLYFNLALVLQKLGQEDEARHWLADAQRLYPGDRLLASSAALAIAAVPAPNSDANPVIAAVPKPELVVK